jgi:hypothetical protein
MPDILRKKPPFALPVSPKVTIRQKHVDFFQQRWIVSETHLRYNGLSICDLFDGGYSMDANPAYAEFIEFIAAGTTPQEIVAFRPSLAAKENVASLVTREKSSGLSLEEQSELDNFLQLEHFMRLLKAKAREHISLE